MRTDPSTPNTTDAPPTPSTGSTGANARPALPPRLHGKVFDVMRPGKAPASPTSRPVITGHKSSAQAAQVHVSGIGAGDRDDLLDSRKKVEVKPAYDTAVDAPGSTKPATAPAEFAAHAAPPEPATPAVETPMATPAAPEPEFASLKPTKKDTDALEPEKPIDPAKLDEAALDPEPPAPLPAEPETALPPAPAEPAYDPIHQIAAPNLKGQVVVSHHTTAPAGTGKLVGLIILMVLFACVVLDILLDAGVFSSSVIPHTNLF